MRFFAGITVFLAFFAAPLAAAAAVQPLDLTHLEQLYLEQLANPESANVGQRIERERARIRTLIDDELNTLVNESMHDEAAEDGDLATAVERQRGLVQGLEQRLNERKVDLDLLEKEEDRYTAPDVTEQPPEGGSTKNYEELLARKAEHEERIAALQFFLQPQRERLSKLLFQERLAQFSTLITVAKIAFTFFLFIFFERLIRVRVLGRIKNPNKRFAARKGFAVTTYAVAIILLLSRISTEFPGIVTSFAIIGAGIAVALQDVVKDIVGWLMIVQGRRFGIGQRVSIGPWTGDVVDIGLFRTTLLDVSTAGVSSGTFDIGRTGKTLYVPNAHVLTQPVLNYNTVSDFIRVEISVIVTYSSDWRQAEKILQHVLQEKTEQFSELARRQQHARMQQFYFAEEAPGPTVYIDIAANGVNFLLRFFVPIGERRKVISEINRAILEQFTTARIDLAYPTTRVVSNEASVPQATASQGVSIPV